MRAEGVTDALGDDSRTGVNSDGDHNSAAMLASTREPPTFDCGWGCSVSLTCRAVLSVLGGRWG